MEKKVYDSLTCKPVMKIRITEKLRQVDKKLIKRKELEFLQEKTWQGNALSIHDRNPFAKIIVKAPEEIHSDMISSIDFDPEELEEPMGLCERTPEDIASSLSLMFNSAKRLLFIDPHIKPAEDRFKEAFRVYFQEIAKGKYRSSPISIEIHTSMRSGYSSNDLRIAKGNAETHFKEILPDGMSLKVFYWSEKDGGERFHNRYILSGVAGVSLGIGLDSYTDADCTEDISHMTSRQHIHRLQQFGSDSTVYSKACPPVEITGE